MPDGLGRAAAKRHLSMRHRGPNDFARSAAQRSSTALPRPMVAPYDQRCTEQGIGIMADVQVTLTLPVLRQGSNPESGPTVIEHLQLMLNERGGFPIVDVDGDFGASTDQSVKHYQQNENLKVDGIVGKQTWTSLLSKWLLQSAPG
jgi:murein L,D-transpeptidase YcbB/YkuD